MSGRIGLSLKPWRGDEKMFLSRLILNPLSRAVLRDISDCQQMHKTVLSAFRAQSVSESPRRLYDVLYRLETGVQSQLILYVQSAIKPDWTKLSVERYLLPTADVENPAVKSIAEPLSRIESGMELRFRLQANPTVKAGTSTKAERLAGKKCNGYRKALQGEENLIRWLQQKGAAGGFRLVAVNLSSEVPDLLTSQAALISGVRVKSPEQGSEAPDLIYFKSVLFEGRLIVTDRSRFLTTLAKGIGSGKAYGFGLLSVAGA